MRFCLPCRRGSAVCDRRSGAYSGPRRVGFRVPLPEPDSEENSPVIIISQSGETADSPGIAPATAKSQGRSYDGDFVNVVGSTIAREADHIFYTLAGPEIAVATTKRI